MKRKLCKTCKETLLADFRGYERIFRNGLNKAGYDNEGRDLLQGMLMGIRLAIKDLEEAEEKSECDKKS